MTQEEEEKKICMSDEDEDSATGCEEDVEMEDDLPLLAANNNNQPMKDSKLSTMRNLKFGIPPSIMTKRDTSPPKIDNGSFGSMVINQRNQMTNFIEKFSQVLNKKPIPLEIDKKPPKQMVVRIMRTEEIKYIHEYWYEYFENLRKTESHSMVKKVLERHSPGLTKHLRAHLIDWITHVCDVLPKEDFTLPFIAANMTDRFFMLTSKTI